MAVKPLRCPHCGGVIETFDETMKKGFCPFCDTLIEDVQEQQTEMIGMAIGEQSRTKQPQKRKWKVIIPLSIFVVLGIVTAMVFMLNPILFFSEEERIAFSAVKEIQNTLLRPESMRLSNIYMGNEESGDTFILVDFNADNKGGGITEASALVICESGNYKIKARTDENYDYKLDYDDEDYLKKKAEMESKKTFTEFTIELRRLKATTYLDNDVIEKIERAIK